LSGIKLRIKRQAVLLAILLLSFSIGFSSSIQVYGQGQIINETSPFPTSSFQSKAAILDNMPSHNVTVGDIDIAYKQIGNADAKPIILITGASATMDMWNSLLLEELTSANYTNKGTPSDSISVITISFLPKPIILKTYSVF
jgi:hypothetical protein